MQDIRYNAPVMAKRLQIVDAAAGESAERPALDSPSELIFEVVEDPECGYRASALGASIFTFAADLDKLRANIREAVSCYYDEDEPHPKIIRLHFVRDEVLAW